MADDYEDLTAAAMTEEVEQELVNTHNECVFMWTNKAGEAFGVVMSYLPKDGKLWLTAAEHRVRIPAIRRFPRACVCINSVGTSIGPGRTVTYKGSVTTTMDQSVKDWFYPEFSDHLIGDYDAARAFQRRLDSPNRVIIEFTPDFKVCFDGQAQAQANA